MSRTDEAYAFEKIEALENVLRKVLHLAKNWMAGSGEYQEAVALLEGHEPQGLSENHWRKEYKTLEAATEIVVRERDDLRSKLAAWESNVTCTVVSNAIDGVSAMQQENSELRFKLELRDREIAGYQEMQQSNLNTINTMHAKLEAAEKDARSAIASLNQTAKFSAEIITALTEQRDDAQRSNAAMREALVYVVNECFANVEVPAIVTKALAATPPSDHPIEKARKQ